MPTSAINSTPITNTATNIDNTSTTSIPNSSISGLAGLFIRHALINKQPLLKAQQQAKAEQQNLIRYLVHHELINPYDIAQVLHQEYGTPLYDLNERMANKEAC